MTVGLIEYFGEFDDFVLASRSRVHYMLLAARQRIKFTSIGDYGQIIVAYVQLGDGTPATSEDAFKITAEKYISEIIEDATVGEWKYE